MSADKDPCIFSRQMVAIVYIYHDGSANENSRFALSNDPVFNNNVYTNLDVYIRILMYIYHCHVM